MIRSHALLLQIGALNVRRRSHHVGVFHLTRAHFTSDKRTKRKKRHPDERGARNQDDENVATVTGRANGVGVKKIEDPPAVKDILRSIFSNVVDLKQEMGTLEKLPPLWTPEKDHQLVRRREAFQKLRTIISDFVHQIQISVIKANGKHRHECSVLLEEIFRLLCLSGGQANGPSAFDECRRLIDLMKNEWMIELQHKHCEYAVVCAGREERWSEAADIFWRHIDPGHGGYNPCDVSLSEPVGLYAIARDAQEKNLLVVEHVFDAVLRMAMVSPSDQERYILAAGTAIGLSGEWKGAVDYVKTSYNASRLGQPLIAAVMNACILCEEYDHAISLYDELLDTNHIANEWQWSGGQDRLHPLCRDLALRAMGHTDQIGTSDRALAMMKTIINDGSKVTIPALYGILLACEKDKRWEEAVHTALLSFALDTQLLLARNDEQLVSTCEGDISPCDIRDGSLQLLLLPVIRVCVAQGYPGVALLSQILFGTLLEDYTKRELSFGDDHRGSFDILARLIASSTQKEELLSAVMVSLCGIEMFAEACMLFEETSSSLLPVTSEELFRWASSQKHARSIKSDEWRLMLDRIRRIVFVFQMAKGDHLNLSVDDVRIISVAVATCMRSSIILSEPEVGLILSKWIESVMSEELASNRNSASDLNSLLITDSYLAAAIAVTSETDGLAFQLIESKLHDSLSKNETTWTLSCNETLRLRCSAGKTREALEFFRVVSNNGNRNPETFEIVATGLANNKEWSGVSGLYGLALRSGFNSEDLSIVAMKAVADGSDAGNMRLLRNIVDEIAEQLGKKPLEWVGSKYWILKETLGFPLMRRLMQWNIQRSARLNELEFSITMFETRVSEGISPEVPTLHSIVRGAIDISHDDMDTPGIPRNVEQWNALLGKVVREAERTSVYSDRNFVSDVALAFWKLGSRKKSADWLDDALSRGVQTRPDVFDLVGSDEEEART